MPPHLLPRAHGGGGGLLSARRRTPGHAGARRPPLPPSAAASKRLSPAERTAAERRAAAIRPPAAAAAAAELRRQAPNAPAVLASLAAAGATLGTLLDGIHSRVGVVVYDLYPAALPFGGPPSSMLVPPLLAAFYASLGGLVIAADTMMLREGDANTASVLAHSSAARLGVSAAALALMLQLSAFLFEGGVESSSICVALALAAFINYALLDNTRQGLALAALCAVAAPAAEAALMAAAGPWHYPAGGLGAGSLAGNWVPWCYFFYTPFVANLARYLRRTL
jgi:heat shock protein 5